jgi:hypothetical protein
VQWHPEEMHAEVRAPDRGLFRALVGAAEARAGEGRAVEQSGVVDPAGVPLSAAPPVTLSEAKGA